MTTRWRGGLATAVALAPFLALAAAEWPVQPDLWYSDFAQYVGHAQALADGRAYTDTGYIFVQKALAWAPPAYPPGLPLALVPVVWASGGHIAAIKVWMILLSAASILVAGAWFWRRVGPLAGIGVIGLVGLSPQWVSLSVSPLSDVVFVGAVWSVLLVADHERRWTWGRVALVTALMGGALAFRPHGLVLLPALVVWGLAHRRKVGSRVFVPPALLAATLLIARALLPAGSMRTAAPDRMIEQLLELEPRYHLAVFDSHLYPLPGDLANDGYHAVTVLLMLLGLAVLVRRVGVALPLVFGALYVLALGSSDASDARYAFPLYPLFVFGLLNGVCWLVGRRDRARAGRLVLAGAAGLALVAAGRGLAVPREPRVMDDPDYRGVVAWVERVREASPEPVRLAFFRPRVLAWETGVRAMPLLSWPRIDGHLDEWCVNDIGYVVIGSVGERMAGRRMERTRDAIAASPGAFEVAYENEAFTAFRLRRDVACPARSEAGRRDARPDPPPDSSGSTRP